MRRNAGLSLVELLVASSVLGLVLAIPLVLLRSSGNLQDARTTRADLEQRSRRALDRIADLLAASGTTVILQWGGGPGVGTATVDFQTATGWAAGATLWGPPGRILLQDDPADPDDGIDNDGDGLIDEKRAVWIANLGLPNERTMVLCEGVRETLEGETPGNGLDDNGNALVDEPGLVFAFDVDRVLVRLSLEARDRTGRRAIRTAERTITFRN